VATASPVKKEEREKNQVAHLNKYDNMDCLSVCRCHSSAYRPPSFACVSSTFVHVSPSSVSCWSPMATWPLLLV